MGDGEKAPLRLQFNPKIRLEFHGSTITSDAGLLAFREFDDALGLTEIAEDYLQDRRTGRNILHHLVPLLRQSIFSRLAGYDDTNDADRLAYDPAMRVVVGSQGSERKAASTSEMGRFETETLGQRLLPGQPRRSSGTRGCGLGGRAVVDPPSERRREESANIEKLLWGPTAVKLDGQGRIYIVDSCRHRLQVYQKG